MKQRDPIDERVVELLNREMRGVGDTLRDEIDRRLGGIERGGGLKVRPDRGAAVAPTGSFWARHRVDVYAVVLAAGLGWALWQLHALSAGDLGSAETVSSPASPATTSPATTSPPPSAASTAAGSPPPPAAGAAPPPAAPSSSPVGSSPEGSSPAGSVGRIAAAMALPAANLRLDLDNPRDSWQAFARAEPSLVAGTMRAAASGQGIAADRVTPATSQRLRAWADEVAVGAVTWSADEREASLLAMFEYVARVQRSSLTTGKVDGVLAGGEYPAAELGPLVADLGLAARLSTLDAAQVTFQAGVVIAWLEALSRSSSRS